MEALDSVIDDEPQPDFTALIRHANSFWADTPMHEPASLTEAQKPPVPQAPPPQPNRLERIRAWFKSDKPQGLSPELRAQLNAALAELKQETRTTPAAQLIKTVRALCSDVVYDGQHRDTVPWDRFIHGRTLLVFKVDPEPDFVRNELHAAIHSIVRPILFQRNEPERIKLANLFAVHVAVALVDYLETTYPAGRSRDIPYETVVSDALDFVSSRLPEEFVKRLLAPQRHTVDAILASQVSQVQPMGRLAGPDKGKDSPGPRSPK